MLDGGGNSEAREKERAPSAKQRSLDFRLQGVVRLRWGGWLEAGAARNAWGVAQAPHSEGSRACFEALLSFSFNSSFLTKGFCIFILP